MRSKKFRAGVYMTSESRYDYVMNENEIAAAPVRRVSLDVEPDEFDAALATCTGFNPTNITRSRINSFAVEYTFDATDADLVAYLDHFGLPHDELDDIFIDA